MTNLLIGTLPNQIPRNGDLGRLAYQDDVDSSVITTIQNTASTYSITVADLGRTIEQTSGNSTFTFSSIASLGAGWYVDLWISQSSNIITLVMTGAEVVDGLTSYIMYARERRRFIVDPTGTVLRSYVITPYLIDLQSGIFTHKQAPGYAFTDLFLVGGGGGGGGGRKGAASTSRQGGICGSAPGTIRRRIIAYAPGTNTTVSIGSGGVGAPSQTTNDTDGLNGGFGATTSYGSLHTAYLGYAGQGGSIGSTFTWQICAGGGSLSAGVNTSGVASVAQKGGSPGTLPVSSSIASGGYIIDASSLEGGASAIGVAMSSGGYAIYGGASAGSHDTSTTTIVPSGSSQFGVGAASYGGWITASNTMPATAPTAGKTGTVTAGGGAAGGTCGASPTAGAAGAANAGGLYDVGNSGAGGGSTLTASVNAGAGGAGTFPGGSGGGGGACLNGSGNSGAGGAGAGGRAVISGVPG